MSLKGKLRFVGQTDTGKVREHNEDTIAFDSDVPELASITFLRSGGRLSYFAWFIAKMKTAV